LKKVGQMIRMYGETRGVPPLKRTPLGLSLSTQFYSSLKAGNKKFSPKTCTGKQEELATRRLEKRLWYWSQGRGKVLVTNRGRSGRGWGGGGGSRPGQDTRKKKDDAFRERRCWGTG